MFSRWSASPMEQPWPLEAQVCRASLQAQSSLQPRDITHRPDSIPQKKTQNVELRIFRESRKLKFA